MKGKPGTIYGPTGRSDHLEYQAHYEYCKRHGWCSFSDYLRRKTKTRAPLKYGPPGANHATPGYSRHKQHCQKHGECSWEEYQSYRMRPRAKRASRKIMDVALRAPDTGLGGHPEAIVAKIQRKAAEMVDAAKLRKGTL